jgi:hypothetical protein
MPKLAGGAKRILITGGAGTLLEEPSLRAHSTVNPCARACAHTSPLSRCFCVDLFCVRVRVRDVVCIDQVSSGRT